LLTVKASIWLIIVVAVIAVLFAVACFYLLVYFQHEEDKGSAYIPKVVLVFGMWLSMIVILMLPLDIANAAVGGIIPMDILWQVVLITAVVWCLVIIPFTQLYYEAYDPTNPKNSQFGSAIKIMLIGAVVFAVLGVVGYLFLSVVSVPIDNLACPLLEGFDTTLPDVRPAGVYKEQSVLEFRVSIVLFLISMLTFVGTFLLACFGGIGLTALPMDMINEFRFRPTQMTIEQYARAKLTYGERATKLVEIGQQLAEQQRTSATRNRKARETFNRFKKNVYLLEDDWGKLYQAHTNRHGRIVLAYLQLVGGIFFTLLSITWILHICMGMLPRTPGLRTIAPTIDFLGEFFRLMDVSTGGLPIAVIFYALFAFYLLWCIMKGNFKFGLRIFVIFPIHPMRLGGTMLNSFLFNVGLILLTSLATLQFCTNAFASYAQFAQANQIFGLSIQRLRYIEYFWYFYTVGIVLIAVLTFVYLLACPSKRNVTDDD
jgi:LMBR1 domain-containing protein 1